MSTKAELKENLLANKLEGVVRLIYTYRSQFLIGLGIGVAAILIGSVFYLRSTERKELALTRMAQVQVLLAQKMYPEAEQVLKELAASPTDRITNAYVSYYLGEASIGLKNYDQAVTYFREASDQSQNHPLRPLALTNLGYALEQKKDYLAAADTYASFMADYAEHFMAPRIQLALGRSYAMGNKPDEAKKALEQLIDLYPSSKWAENARQIVDKIKTR